MLAATAAGGRVVLLAGEAGIGKSALVRRFAERQSADARFLVGACDPLLTPRALGPLHDIARQTGGRLAELLASGGPREQLFAAFLDELDRSRRARQVVRGRGRPLGRRGHPGPAGVPGAAAGAHPGAAARHLPRRRAGRRPSAARGPWRRCPRGWCAGCGRSRCPRRPWPSWPGGPAVPASGLRELTGGNPLLVTEVLAAGDAGVPHDRPRPGAGPPCRPAGATPRRSCGWSPWSRPGPSCGCWRRPWRPEPAAVERWRRGRVAGGGRRRRSGSATSCCGRRSRARCRPWPAGS